MSTIFQKLGEQIRRARKARGMSQSGLAQRVGRSFTRVSELERDLIGERWGRDRLTLFAEICDALDLVPVLVPRARAARIEGVLETPAAAAGGRRDVASAFDELFVDLDEERGEQS